MKIVSLIPARGGSKEIPDKNIVNLNGKPLIYYTIQASKNSSIDELIVTNSIPLTPDAKKCSKIRVISLANIIAECIKRLSNEESLSEMFL